MFVLKCAAQPRELSLSVNVSTTSSMLLSMRFLQILKLSRNTSIPNLFFRNSLITTAVSCSWQPKHKIDLNYFIIIMFITSLRQYQPLLLKSLLPFAKINTVKYTSPPSQLQQFKKHVNNIDNVESMKQAASLLARLENDEQLYKEKLIEIQQETKEQFEQFREIVDVFDRTCKMELEIENQTAENREIEERCFKEIENIKVYGITRIAKEVIETLDHLKQALQIIDDSNVETRTMQMGKLNQIISAFEELLQKYEIREFSPLDEPFNPNQQESIGQLQAPQPDKKNRVAKVERSGFKLKDRLLRSAFVIIYI